jgi:hypothetical protein
MENDLDELVESCLAVKFLLGQLDKLNLFDAELILNVLEVLEAEMNTISSGMRHFEGPLNLLDFTLGHFQTLFRMLEQHRNEIALQMKIMWVLNRCMSDHPQCKELVAEAGGIPRILTTLQLHYADCYLIALECCGALSHLATEDTANQTEIASRDGFALIVAAMQSYPTESDLQNLACLAVRSLVKDNTDNQVLFAQQPGGIEAILAFMQRDLDEEVAQCFCCEVFYVLSQSIGSAHGIDAILTAMRRHSGEEAEEEDDLHLFEAENSVPSYVQVCGMGALSQLALNESNKSRIVELGGIHIIVSAMRRHIANARVQEMGCLAIGSLAREDRKNVVRIGHLEHGFHALAAASEKYPDNSQVQSAVSGALFYIARASPLYHSY